MLSLVQATESPVELLQVTGARPGGLGVSPLLVKRRRSAEAGMLAWIPSSQSCGSEPLEVLPQEGRPSSGISATLPTLGGEEPPCSASTFLSNCGD